MIRDRLTKAQREASERARARAFEYDIDSGIRMSPSKRYRAEQAALRKAERAEHGTA